MKCGVPQGSILGPVPFILYTSDLIHIVENWNFTCLTDDASIIIKSTDINDLKVQMIQIMTEIQQWLFSNKLILNYDKTVYCFIYPGANINDLQ